LSFYLCEGQDQIHQGSVILSNVLYLGKSVDFAASILVTKEETLSVSFISVNKANFIIYVN